MAAPKPMNVLLQGDVGAGKTLVALHACLVAVQSGHQAAIMAPTEVLAAQHYRSIDGLLEGVGAVRYLDLAKAVEKADDGQVSLLDPEPGSDDATRGLGDLRPAHRLRHGEGPRADPGGHRHG